MTAKKKASHATAATTPHSPSCRRFLRKPRRIAHGLELARSAHEAVEQRMAVARRRGEFRVELAGDEPGVLLFRQLDDLDQQIVHRFAGDHQAQILELLPVAVVELVAMAM